MDLRTEGKNRLQFVFVFVFNFTTDARAINKAKEQNLMFLGDCSSQLFTLGTLCLVQ